jgi:electron transfer flavoprotein alpha/beta subunit
MSMQRLLKKWQEQGWLEIKEVTLAEAGVEILEMLYPPKKPEGRIVGEGPEAAAELVKLLRDEAQVL